MSTTVLFWTVVAIMASSLVGVLFSRRKKDPCLKDFQNYFVTVQHKNGKRIWGRLVVETSGVEFKYKGNYLDNDHVETSFIMYKEEFPNIFVLFRFLDELDGESVTRRKKSLSRSYRPGPVRRSARWAKNTLSMIKDSLTEALGTTLAQGKALNPALNAMSYQHKYVTKVQSDALGMLNNTYDPILERHIGTMVVMEVTSPGGVVEEYVGIFKEYSQQFVEIMDVTFKESGKVRAADMVVPRAHAQIRHSAEPIKSGITITKNSPPRPAGQPQPSAAQTGPVTKA